MAYSTGMMRYRVKIVNPADGTEGDFGARSAGIAYEYKGEFWAAMDWTRGLRAMREGAFDAYDIVMLRMRYNDVLRRDSLVLHDDRVYMVTSLHRDYHENTIQATLQETSQTIDDLDIIKNKES